MQLRDIDKGFPAIKRLAAVNFARTKTSWWVAKIWGKLLDNTKKIDDVRSELLEKYGTKNDKGALVIPPGSPLIPDFMKEFDAALDSDIEWDVKMMDGRLLEEAKLTAQELITLAPFFDFSYLEAEEEK